MPEPFILSRRTDGYKYLCRQDYSTEVNMKPRVVHFEIIGKDGEALIDFYRKAFGWEIDDSNPMQYGLVQAQGEGSIGGGIASGESGQPGYVTVYIEVDDPDKYLAQIASLGGKTIVPTTTVPGMVTFALFADPEGHTIGLIKSESK